jgi:uncharacterized membrane protein YphA (DoxX/SURF4 family)
MAKSIAYWITTGIVALILLSAGIAQVTEQPANVEGFARLGYPAYFMVYLGVWKLAGGIVILVPRLPRAKEWAYAGILIDFTSAVVSHAVHGDGPAHVALPVVCIAILVASWRLRPARRIVGEL